MRRRRATPPNLGGGVAVAALLLLISTFAHAQDSPRTVWDRVYSEAQAQRGRAIFLQECSNCHGRDLEGADMTPPLTGGAFMANWDGLTIGDLADRIRISMPLASPGTLSRQQIADIVAYILRFNEFPAGTEELPRESAAMKQILMKASRPAAQSPPANIYRDPKSWLCRPERLGACDVDLTATIIAADGTLTRETWKADPNAPIDCFYVYPTVSTDPTPNSDMTADAAELNVIRQQFARFASKCRPYAPLYRQVTLAGLRTRLAAGGGGSGLARGIQYDDVRDAWNYYLEHDNNGRGFVLVAHSH